jgi:hypothetical protein
MTEPSRSAEAILKRDNSTIEKFRKLLTGGMSSLYLLPFLLTGNRKEAYLRKCFKSDREDVMSKTTTTVAASFAPAT